MTVERLTPCKANRGPETIQRQFDHGFALESWPDVRIRDSLVELCGFWERSLTGRLRHGVIGLCGS